MPVKVCASVTKGREIVALTLALCAVLLGLMPLRPSALLQIGRPATLAVNSR